MPYSVEVANNSDVFGLGAGVLISIAIVLNNVYLGAAVGIALLWFLPASIPGPVRETTAWCLGAATYLTLAFRLMRSCHADRIRLRAGIQDDSGILILGLILLAIFFQLQCNL